MANLAQKRAKSWLEKGQLRPTSQRLILAELLVGDGKNCHITAEQLFEKATKKGKISLATVYNTLHAFCASGLMKEITIDIHKSYFDTRIDEHPHFYWEDGTLSDAPKQELKFNKIPSHPEGTEIIGIDVVIRLRNIA